MSPRKNLLTGTGRYVLGKVFTNSRYPSSTCIKVIEDVNHGVLEFVIEVQDNQEACEVGKSKSTLYVEKEFLRELANTCNNICDRLETFEKEEENS